mgnify:FL=1
MSKIPTDLELFKLMTPEQQGQFLGMLYDVAAFY